MATDQKISTIVDQQFPFFVRDDGPNLVAFLKAYYEWTEQANNAIEVSKNLINYQDIDKTYEKYLEFFHREIMDDIPRDVLANRNKLAKHIKDLYRSRGSQLSYQLLFRILYNEEIDFYYPGEDILRASDGRWVLEKSIRVGPPKSSSYSADAFVNNKIIGLSSLATARVERADLTLSSGVVVDEFYLIDIEGTFEDNEEVALFDDRTVKATLFATSGPLQSLTIQKGGAFHQTGDSVNLLSTSGSGANGVVLETTGTSAAQWSIERGGSGYTLGSTINIDHGSGFESSFSIATLSNTEVVAINSDTILPMANVVLNTGPFFVSLGANTTAVSANLATANVSSKIVNGLQFTNTTFGTINSLSQSNYGYGYNPTLPGANVTEPLIADTFTIDPDGGFKGRNAVIVATHAPGAISSVKVSNFGSEYSRFDPITINNLTRAGTQSAVGFPNISGIINYPGKYIDTKGWLSWNNKLQDNFYYQEFSYELKTSQVTNTYRQLVHDIVHPAGTKMFGRYTFYSDLQTTLAVMDDSSVTYNIENTITLNVPEVVSDTVSEYVETAANTSPEITYNTLTAEPTVVTAESIFNIMKTARGTISISSNNIIGAYASIPISTYASMPIGNLGQPTTLVGNNTFFTSDIPMANTRIMIVGGAPFNIANGVYFIANTSSNTNSTISYRYVANTLTNGTFFYNTLTENTYDISVTNSGTGAYALTGVDRLATVSGNNKTVTINVNDTVNFAVNASGHPFYIKTAAGTGTGNQVTTPTATNQGAQVGTVSWKPNTAGTYFYQCSNHSAMVGQIIVRAAGTA